MKKNINKYPLYHTKIIQQTEAWKNLRKGKMTASNAQAIGNNGKGLDSYILKIMSEYYSTGENEYYSNKDIDRGNELEEQAREMYELETGNEVLQVGFIEIDEFTGCSPDGLIGDEGGMEIKCQNDLNHYKTIVKGEKEIDTKYIWQIQMSLFLTGRKWWDYVGYNPNFKKSLVIHRIYPDEKKQAKIEEGIKNGIIKIKELKKLNF